MLPASMPQALVKSVEAGSVQSLFAVAQSWRQRFLCSSNPQITEAKASLSEVSQLQTATLPASGFAPLAIPQEIDPVYLFACHVEWERREDASAGWELIAAAQSHNSDTRAHARALLAASHHLGGFGSSKTVRASSARKRSLTAEDEMKTPYGLDIVDNCTECNHSQPGHFCGFSDSVLSSLDKASHKSTLPAGAILFVEGQEPRGMFIICSGRVNLSTTSREGKILILKTAEAGEALGLSATISSMGYETTAEAATPCQLCFIDTKHLLQLMDKHSELAVHAAHCLSRDYQSAYRDIHDWSSPGHPRANWRDCCSRGLPPWKQKTKRVFGQV